MTALAYLQQRFHPALEIGSSAYVWRGERKVSVHCQQGDLDGACGALCAAMALTLLDRIHSPAVLSERTRGIASRLWRISQKNYFDGLNFEQLASVIKTADFSLKVKKCSRAEPGILKFIRKELSADRLVIVSWHAVRGDRHHWILIVGTEEIVDEKKYRLKALLALDPGTNAPLLSGYNGRLDLINGSGATAIACKPLMYEGAWQERVGVTLTAAVSLG